MNFVETILSCQPVLTEGSVVERLRRDGSMSLDPHILHAGFVRDEHGRRGLARLYKEYFDIGQRYDLPMVGFTPTWRASVVRLKRAGFDDAAEVNGDCVRFVNDIREEYGPYARKIFIGGLIGCSGDAYNPAEALESEGARAYHRSQLRALAAAGVDFLFAATLPAFSEAHGMAMAMAECGIPYALSFVLRQDGTILDGTPLHVAIARIDATVYPPPLFYISNCVHPSTLEKALDIARRYSPDVKRRFIGLQANSSRRRPEELDNLAYLDSEAPETLAGSMVLLHRRFGLRVLGGCCGTDSRHIECIAGRLASINS